MDDKKRFDLDCEIVSDLLPLYHDGVVNEKTRAAVARHVAQCEKCRSELQVLREDLPCDKQTEPATQKKFANLMRNQRNKRILWTGISVVLVTAILIGAYFGQLQLPIFEVPDEEITVHRVYRYEIEEGYKFFLLYSSPSYDYMHLGTEVESDGSTQVFDLKKPLISSKSVEVSASGRVDIYGCGWTSADDGGRDFCTFEQIKFGDEIVWTEENAGDPVPDYVYAYEEMHSSSGEVTGFITGADEGYVGAIYADGRTVIWDLDGNVISEN